MDGRGGERRIPPHIHRSRFPPVLVFGGSRLEVAEAAARARGADGVAGKVEGVRGGQ